MIDYTMTTATANLMNYEFQDSNSKNYSSVNPSSSSSPESFPVLMEDGLIIQYEFGDVPSKIVSKKEATREVLFEE